MGIEREMFHELVGDLAQAEAARKKLGRSSLRFENQLCSTLNYWLEYRTLFHLCLSHGVHESNAQRIVKRVEKRLDEARVGDSIHATSSAGFRPEAEWEYACRAGTQTAFHFGNELSLDLVNYRGTWNTYENWGRDAKQATTPVKKYLCNVWGLYDMHGNVWEWCEDVWQEHLSSKENSTQFPNDASNQPLKQKLVRVLRGGAWSYSARYVRSAVRRGDSSSLRSNCIGFRLILSDV